MKITRNNDKLNAHFGLILEESASSITKGSNIGGNEGFAYGRP